MKDLLNFAMNIKDKDENIVATARHSMGFLCADEKHRRDLLGMAKSGSKWVCTLCDVKSEDLTDRDKIGTWQTGEINVNDLSNLVKYLNVNPDELDAKKMHSISRGMSHLPITSMDPHCLPPDSLHMMINNTTNLKTCLEISVANEGISTNAKWSKSNVESLRDVGRGLVNTHLNKLIGYVT